MEKEIEFDHNLRPYKAEGGFVCHNGDIIKGADGATFQPLNHHFSIDFKHVFSGTEVLRGGSPHSFRVLNEIYATDGKNIYYNHGVVAGVDCKSFSVLDAGFWRGDYGVVFEGYARDKSGIWFYSRGVGIPRMLKNAEPGSFEVLPYAHAKDAKRVFFAGLPVTKADPASFELITQRYARDRSKIFYGNTVLEGVDYDSFEVVDAAQNHAKDKYHLFERHKQVDAFL